MPTKYHKGTEANNYVSYRELDEGGVVLEGHHNAACFASIFNGSIHKKSRVIELYHSLSLIPYDKPEIERWVNIISEIGFPCTIKFDDKEAVFRLTLDNYQWKLHVLSTLMLLRLLMETALTLMPEKLFQLQDDNPAIDKFKTLVDLHMNTSKWNVRGYPNAGHMVIAQGCNDGRATVDNFEDFINNCKASKMGLHFDGRGPKYHRGIYAAWSYGYAEPLPKPPPEGKPKKTVRKPRAKKAQEAALA
jgi:hypothetical protein